MIRRRRTRNTRAWRWLILAILGWLGWSQVVEPPRSPQKSSTRAFQVLLNARLHPHRDNDGDSFHLSLKEDQVHQFRLYFADCPEKKRHLKNGDRLADQGRYFGGLNESQTLSIGRQAELFTRQLLTDQPFTVYTKWHEVYDSGRYYAFILFADGEDLSAKLVRAGLARIHTTGTTLPDGRSTRDYQQYLRELEASARAARQGAWSLR